MKTANETRAVSVEEYEYEIGMQIRQLRIRAGYDQIQLAELAAVSRSALKNLEAGRGSTLATLVKVVRALKQTEWLRRLSPISSMSPMQLLRNQQLTSPRQRVYRPRPKSNPAQKED